MLELIYMVRKGTHTDSTFDRYLRIPNILEIKKEDVRHMPLNEG